MGTYASTGAARIPSILRTAPSHVHIGQTYRQDMQPPAQYGFDVLAIINTRENIDDWFVVALPDPSVVDVHFMGLRLFLEQLRSLGVPLTRIMFICRDTRVELKISGMRLVVKPCAYKLSSLISTF